MTRGMLGFSVVVFLLVFAGITHAEDQNQPTQPITGNDTSQVMPKPPEPNAQQDTMSQQERIQQMREQARQRIRERIEQHRKDEASRPMRPGRMMDANLARLSDTNRMPPAVLDANQLKRQSATIEQVMSQEEAKYRERMARLSRIRELAQQEGDVNTAAMAEQLLSQDLQLHQLKTRNMASRKAKIAEYAERLKAMKDVNDVNKPIGQPRGNKK
jgi:hypothetical protein